MDYKYKISPELKKKSIEISKLENKIFKNKSPRNKLKYQ